MTLNEAYIPQEAYLYFPKRKFPFFKINFLDEEIGSNGLRQLFDGNLVIGFTDYEKKKIYEFREYSRKKNYSLDSQM